MLIGLRAESSNDWLRMKENRALCFRLLTPEKYLVFKFNQHGQSCPPEVQASNDSNFADSDILYTYVPLGEDRLAKTLFRLESIHSFGIFRMNDMQDRLQVRTL